MATILHIEDHPANQTLIERILTANGYEVIHAADGESGIEAAIDYVPDLILIDMGLPDMDGQTVVTLLKQLSFLKHTPLVAITAWPAEKAYEIADRYELAGCILKPIDVKAFPGLIARFLEDAKQEAQENNLNEELSGK
ncbi:MAG: response regulator [Candidatus Promineifilaceae bacterium]